MPLAEKALAELSFQDFKKQVLDDYLLANQSRNLSITGRKEVLTGKAKFGIFGDGKEIAQIAMARNFRPGDWRSGYYRDQTFMLATGMFSLHEFFNQLYGVTDTRHNPSNGGRSFNNHYGTRNIDEKGEWLNLMDQPNTASDISPTAGQMPRMLGLGLASKFYRQNKKLHSFTKFTNKGNEVVFGTIGDASTSEGHFFETLNAAAVMQIPLALAVWDDGYGISVEKKIQTVKSSISEALMGFEKRNGTNGIIIYRGKGWAYPELCKLFEEGITRCRKEHVPVLFHIDEITQPLGHSTSGSHERYKSSERLAWEQEYDCIARMKKWILEHRIASEKELEEIENRAVADVRKARDESWKIYQTPILNERKELLSIVEGKSCLCRNDKVDKLSILTKNLKNIKAPIRKDNMSSAKKILRSVCNECPQRELLTKQLSVWFSKRFVDKFEQYNAFLYVENQYSALNVQEIKPVVSDKTTEVPGREINRENFDRLFGKYPLLVAFGEDVGKIGGVNQTYAGLQEKYGEHRIFDTGIRETSIIGKGIGLALRGFRPIAEIQYFDYLLYALQTISDDLATTHWRTAGGQIVPLIISTRGHRFEGIWHAGSPLSMIINSVRGVFVCTPRNMTQAAGFYNTLLKGNDPGLVIEPLIGYRLKELMPDNIGEYCVPLGIPEVLTEGTDITIVTYGSCVRIARDAVKQLREFDIRAELIDVQTLLPFDINETIVESVRKTNRVLFFDEDVPGGATSYMMQKVMEEQRAYRYIDAEPRTLTAMDHRPAYARDGDYFSNPNAENVFDTVYEMMYEADPGKYPSLYE
ncbi:MAG: thiamine pyrophosphate-dependent enzyme [Bacteroidales bacterium]|jgi:pyruvate/2-oxoglutarate/acetoin dehydrogenase E1 component/TPP-dependent pyruvate/acetoin dehydrogenase alpha subunit